MHEAENSLHMETKSLRFLHLFHKPGLSFEMDAPVLSDPAIFHYTLFLLLILNFLINPDY